MLKLELTDGFRTVSALEFSPIPILNTHLLPGLKVLVSGPLRCVNHILFLEAKHIKILGGEVATFTIENAYENVLRKKLEQPINPNPRTEYQGNLQTQFNPFVMRFVHNFVSSKIESAVAAESNASNQLNGIPSIPMTAANSAIRSNAISSRNQFNIIDDFPDDDFLNDIDIDEIASNAVNGAAPPVHASSARHDDTIPPIRRNTLLFDDMDDNDFLNIDSNIDLIGVAPKTETVQSDARSEVSTRSESSTRSEVIDTAMNSAFLTSPASSISADKYQFKIRGLNLATIKQLTECSPQDRYRRKHFIVKAFIENVAQKVRIAKKQWKLNVRLGDDLSANVTMEAAMSPDVLDKLAKISGREVSQMYAKKEENPQLEDELGQIIERLSTTLDDLDAFMKIEFDASAPFPVVVEVIDKAPVLERKLQEKIQHERLS